MSHLEENKAIVRRFVEAVNARDYDALEAITAPDIVRHCPATPDVVVRSREDLRRFLTRDAEIFPDNCMQLDTVTAEGDLVAFWATYTGTQKGAMGVCSLPKAGVRRVRRRVPDGRRPDRGREARLG
jgi:ketosteroid isomerase-like protein